MEAPTGSYTSSSNSFYNTTLVPLFDKTTKFLNDSAAEASKFCKDKYTEGKDYLEKCEPINTIFQDCKTFTQDHEPYSTYVGATLSGFTLGNGIACLRKKGLSSIRGWAEVAIGSGAGYYMFFSDHSADMTAKTIRTAVLYNLGLAIGVSSVVNTHFFSQTTRIVSDYKYLNKKR